MDRLPPELRIQIYTELLDPTLTSLHALAATCQRLRADIQSCFPTLEAHIERHWGGTLRPSRLYCAIRRLEAKRWSWRYRRVKFTVDEVLEELQAAVGPMSTSSSLLNAEAWAVTRLVYICARFLVSVRRLVQSEQWADIPAYFKGPPLRDADPPGNLCEDVSFLTGKMLYMMAWYALMRLPCPGLRKKRDQLAALFNCPASKSADSSPEDRANQTLKVIVDIIHSGLVVPIGDPGLDAFYGGIFRLTITTLRPEDFYEIFVKREWNGDADEYISYVRRLQITKVRRAYRPHFRGSGATFHQFKDNWRLTKWNDRPRWLYHLNKAWWHTWDDYLMFRMGGKVVYVGDKLVELSACMYEKMRKGKESEVHRET